MGHLRSTHSLNQNRTHECLCYASLCDRFNYNVDGEVKTLHPKTQRHGNRPNVTSVVMLRVNCRTSNEKKK
jgi:hypothetical protein